MRNVTSKLKNSTVANSVIVIGGGLGGLSSAIRLAKKGFNVQIFERSTTLGGKCRVEKFGEYSFDTGPSLLTLPAVYRDLFLKTGAPLEEEVRLQPVDPAFEYHFANGKRLTLPNASRAGVAQAIEESFGAISARQWVALMDRAAQMWDAAREPFVESELRGIWSLLRQPHFLSKLKKIAPFTSLRDLASQYLTTPELITIIDRYATYTGSDPRKAPAVLLTIAYIEQVFGAWHIEGGIGELSKALERRAHNLGITIHLNSEVEAILTHDKSAIGVALVNGDKYFATHVISNVDAQITYEKLLPKLRSTRGERRKLERATPSFSGFYLLLGLQGVSENRRHHTISFPADYDAEFDSLFISQTPVSDPTIYICSPNDQRMSPSTQHESWFVLVNAPRHLAHGTDSVMNKGFDWLAPGVGKNYCAHVIDLLVARGLLDRERIESVNFRTPADIESLFNAPGGSIYGKSSNGAAAAFNRASNRSPIKGLYLAGGSAHPGGGVPLVGISGEIVANAIGDVPSQ